MRVIKQILIYLLWYLVALFLGFLHMRIMLGPQPEYNDGILSIFNWVYEAALIVSTSIMGSIIAVLFILFDLFYLRKKLSGKPHHLITRLAVMVVIALIVIGFHYLHDFIFNVV
ncbi:hypothetical protein LY01_02931 [Nonlabens xylanidelens]|uniref:Uncharacterized protein n=1 Tax=Nonlabens xylanidelens TaxID=191564 RepID=A0A2S6IEE2_9FLAO|nr:hypothetical protein [Nonlabens xylanidelens]PPK92530.1 hypothetical protein LY01_02931 [Nonlabens xylanidelens]